MCEVLIVATLEAQAAFDQRELRKFHLTLYGWLSVVTKRVENT